MIKPIKLNFYKDVIEKLREVYRSDKKKIELFFSGCDKIKNPFKNGHKKLIMRQVIAVCK